VEDEWTEMLADGTLVAFTAQEIAGDGALFTAQIAGHHVRLFGPPEPRKKARSIVTRSKVASSELSLKKCP
jgi:hypothetical protein